MLPEKNHKLSIYQIFTRLFGNQNSTNRPKAPLEINGCGKFNDINASALKSIKELGITHVWYTGIIHHAQITDYSTFGIPQDPPAIVKGIAGSPYAIKDYYDVDPDLAVDVENRMAEFESLLERTHQHELKVIIDFVPNHVSRTYRSLQLPEGTEDLGAKDDCTVIFSPQNNYYYLPGQTFVAPEEESSNNPYTEIPAKATGNDVFSPTPTSNDWYETIKLNYGVDYLQGGTTHFDPIPSTWYKMADILLFWASKGVDGFRCDMAEMVPVEFWEWAIGKVKEQYPNLIFIAEIYNPQLYHRFIFQGGFDYLYDKVSLYNRLRPLVEGHGNAEDLTWVWQHETGNISKHMLRFLENHDEQRIASAFFANNPWNALPAMVLCTTMNEGPFMIYFGQEIGINSTCSEGFQGNDGRTTIFDYWGITEWQNWINKGNYNDELLTDSQKKLRTFYQSLCHFVFKSDAIIHGGFYDLQYVNSGQSPNYNQHKIYSYLRHSSKQQLLCVYNFDLQQSYVTSIRIPAQVCTDLLYLQENKVYSYIVVFSNHQYEKNSYRATVTLEEIHRSGLPITLPPNSVFLLEIVDSN